MARRLGTTNLWLDTEFNSYKGALISLALVDAEGREFYEVLECEAPYPWVKANVLPHLGKASVSKQELQAALSDFLRQYSAIHVIADWPEDIQHFCETLITGPGYRIDTPLLTMEVRRDLNSDKSLIPHNALSDARAIRDAHLMVT